jgi:hypothetical protein
VKEYKEKRKEKEMTMKQEVFCFVLQSSFVYNGAN